MTITNDQMIILQIQNATTLAKWYCELSEWRWPGILPDPEDATSRITTRHVTRAHLIMDWIKNRVGERFISRIHNSGMTDEEHNDFWRGCHEGHVESKERFESRLLERCKSKESV